MKCAPRDRRKPVPAQRLRCAGQWAVGCGPWTVADRLLYAHPLLAPPPHSAPLRPRWSSSPDRPRFLRVHTCASRRAGPGASRSLSAHPPLASPPGRRATGGARRRPGLKGPGAEEWPWLGRRGAGGDSSGGWLGEQAIQGNALPNGAALARPRGPPIAEPTSNFAKDKAFPGLAREGEVAEGQEPRGWGRCSLRGPLLG